MIFFLVFFLLILLFTLAIGNLKIFYHNASYMYSNTQYVKEPLHGAARPVTCGSLTKRVMMINLEVGGLLEVVR